ncbi:MAG: alanyl-tRNA editing protein [Marinovum sp.]|nr:alanyl-tRNA editing protein [Marinovum sp.]
MNEKLFLQDSYLREAPAQVVDITPEGGIVLNQSLFYATSGGQPGDGGVLHWDGQETVISTSVKGEAGQIICLSAEGSAVPKIGQEVLQVLDWDKRHLHMRMHTALHLLSVVIPLPVTGGAITSVKGRLDFNMPQAPEDKEALGDALNDLISRDLEILEEWITERELDENPSLVKTMSVAPPRGAGKIRLIRIGADDSSVDLQPCGGTHVARTGEIGRVRIGKVEKKGQLNRRVHLHFDD